MEKLNFQISINASRNKIWDVLWNDETYRKWTAVFSPGSYAVTDWQEGSKTLFLSSDGSGMVSTIAKNIPFEFLSIKHLGFVKNGIEDTESEEVKKWAGALENYTLKEAGESVLLEVSMDMNDEYKDYFLKVFPQALQLVKDLAEND
jgi:uncharacterized protein YndB with AHSA1/START domain